MNFIKEININSVIAKWTKQKLSIIRFLPSIEVELDNYTNTLEVAMDDSGVSNIGITGYYGSGKSTIIETYKNKFKKKRFIHISVANFFDKSEQGNNLENKLEKEIINQIAIQVESKNIPRTRFKVKINISYRQY